MSKGTGQISLSELLKNPAAVIIVILLLIFFIMILIPQSFWVNLSMKFFK
jgi:hypothetical protein